MKMIRLTMQAFMTYKDKTTIDFENMLHNGLYLISGPTGAGKTTIFDAMTFALYGVASGSHRNQAYFRSDFADAKEETYVEMIFELHQQLYTVKRSPTYTRPGYKTAKMANAYLSYNDVIIEGVKEVNQKLNQLLGVDVHQFKQIVMIAQGEFTKLIYASSEEREKVLRHIFHSEPLVAFENLLKEETKSYKDRYLLSSQQLLSRFQLLSFSQDFMEQHASGFHPSFIEDAFIENQKVHEQLLISQSQYTKSQQSYDQFSQSFYQKQKQNQNIEEYQQLQKQYQQLLLKQDDMNHCQKDIIKMKIIEQNQTFIYQYHQTKKETLHIQNDLQCLNEKQEKLSKQFLLIQEQYKHLPQMKKQKDEMMLSLEQMNQSLQRVEEYQSLQNKKKILNNQLCERKKDYDEQFTLHHQFEKRMERDQENVDRLPKLQLELQQNEQLVKEMNQRRISIHELSEFYDRLTQYQDRHFELSEKYRKADEKYQQTFLLYRKEDEIFKRQQAGILAQTLKEHEPCPVCGSLEHPCVAILSQHVLSSNELEELNQEVDKKKQLKEECYQEVLIQNERIQEIRTRIEMLKKQLNIEDELSKEVFIHLLSDIIAIIKEHEKDYQKRYTEVEYLQKIKKSLSQDHRIFEQQTEKLELCVKQIHDDENALIACQTQLLELEKNYQLLNVEHLKEEYKKLQKDYQKLGKTMDVLEKEYHQCQQEITLLTHQKENLLQQKEELTSLLQQLQKDFDKLIQESFESLELFQYYESILPSLAKKEKEYQDYIILKGSLHNQLDVLKKQTENVEWVDLSQEHVKLQELEKQRENYLKEYNGYLHIYEQNDKLIQQLQKDYQKNQDVFEKYTIYQDLSDMTSGKNGQRMSFERYVLSSYFEHILEYANVELLKMSQGRFALYRKQETKGAKQQGLDLSVLDYETGMMRDIQSLSGGESFKAALSLALGLSAMIQSYAGGIELNTLFIDEGFGTLDSESIDQALSVLLDLKNDNKVIGIISHVDELKERIHTQIVVEKGIQGSFVHIEKE